MGAAAYKIKKKKNGRFSVVKKGGKTINGEEKLKILIEAGIVKQAMPKPAPVEEAPAEEAAAPAEAEEAAEEKKEEGAE
jgi:hypothetical protein